MKRIKVLLVAGLAALGVLNSSAQTRDISVTISPNVSYNWWNENIALNNSPFYGARVGFGFGPFFELRGTFDKSINLKNALKDKNWNPLTPEQLQKLEGMNIDVTRFGAETKINFLDGYIVAPYITLGGGVQILDYNPFDSQLSTVVQDAKQKEQQLYLSAGLGLKLALSDRIAFTLEGKNIRFNMDNNNPLLNPAVNQETKRWGNWSAVASLDFYLGGTTVDTAQRDLYSDGFKGAKFVLEPGIMYVDFKDKMLRPDQWFLGGAVGVDFNSLIGLRGFYYQATKQPNKLSFDFNKDVRMYGLNMIARLNFPRGILPYLQFGAGYLDDDNFIANPQGTAFKTHNLFGLAGAGIELPLSRYFSLFGTANAMLMTNRAIDDITKVSQPSDIVTNLAYSAGLRINLGQAAEVPTTYALTTDENEAINQSRETETRRTLFGESTKRVYEADMMTKGEFEDMVDRVLQKIRSEEELRAANFSKDEMNVIIAALQAQNPQAVADQRVAANNEQLIAEMRSLVNALDRQNSQQSSTHIYTQPSYASQAPVVAPTTQVAPVYRTDPYAVEHGQVATARTSFMKLNRLSVLTGVNLGEGTQWQLGVRGHMQISNTQLDFVPELAVGFGKNQGFDLSANVVYNIPVNWGMFKPYAGLGLGIFTHGVGTKLHTNLILGTTFFTSPTGEFFADYSARGLFKNNQIAVGYRFVF